MINSDHLKKNFKTYRKYIFFYLMYAKKITKGVFGLINCSIIFYHFLIFGQTNSTKDIAACSFTGQGEIYTITILQPGEQKITRAITTTIMKAPSSISTSVVFLDLLYKTHKIQNYFFI